MAAEGDNLDARMEAIRLKNEELEKKHKEIMEDEELAKRENAVVDVKKTDIPKHHPYDNVDLDFDVKDTDKEMAKNPDYKPKNRRPPPRTDLLDEIPPDPVNFLREDGDEQPKSEPNQSQRPPNKNRNFNRNRPERQKSDEADMNSGESPNRGMNNRRGPQQPRPPHQQQNRSPPYQQQQNRSPQHHQQQQNRSPPQDGNAQRRPIHPQQLRNERRSVPAQYDEPQQQQMGHSPQHQGNRQRRPNNRPPNKEGGDRSNITVQITDGEVRSVKLRPTEKKFGSGRVRPGENRGDNERFTVDTFDPNSPGEMPQQDRSPQDRQRNRNPRNNNNNNNNRRNPKPREFQHPTLENLIIPKASVQDRLMKISKNSDDPEVKAEPETPPVTPATPVEAIQNGD